MPVNLRGVGDECARLYDGSRVRDSDRLPPISGVRYDEIERPWLTRGRLARLLWSRDLAALWVPDRPPWLLAGPQTLR